MSSRSSPSRRLREILFLSLAWCVAGEPAWRSIICVSDSVQGGMVEKTIHFPMRTDHALNRARPIRGRTAGNRAGTATSVCPEMFQKFCNVPPTPAVLCNRVGSLPTVWRGTFGLVVARSLPRLPVPVLAGNSNGSRLGRRREAPIATLSRRLPVPPLLGAAPAPGFCALASSAPPPSPRAAAGVVFLVRGPRLSPVVLHAPAAPVRLRYATVSARRMRRRTRNEHRRHLSTISETRCSGASRTSW